MAYNNLLSRDRGNNHWLIKSNRNAELMKEVMECLSNFLRLILMNNVATLIYDNEFEFSLHLCDSELLIHSV